MVMLPAAPRESAAPTRASATTARLRELLLKGVFPPDSRLYEVELARQLGVSRTPVREALSALAREGLASYSPNRGYQVRACTFEDVVGAYLVRRALEALACRLAARNGLSVQQRARMMDSIERNAELLASSSWRIDSAPAWAELNSEFHNCIAEAALNNPLARAINDTHRMPMLVSGGGTRLFTRYDLLAFFDDNSFRKSHEEHVQILDALVKRREDVAAETMDRHIGRAGKVFEENWKSGFSGSAEPDASGTTGAAHPEDHPSAASSAVSGAEPFQAA